MLGLAALGLHLGVAVEGAVGAGIAPSTRALEQADWPGSQGGNGFAEAVEAGLTRGEGRPGVFPGFRGRVVELGAVGDFGVVFEGGEGQVVSRSPGCALDDVGEIQRNELGRCQSLGLRRGGGGRRGGGFDGGAVRRIASGRRGREGGARVETERHPIYFLWP